MVYYICPPAEGTNAGQHLRWVLVFVQIDSLECIVGLEIERLRLTGSEKMGYIFHLDKWHGRLLKANAWRAGCEVCKSAQHINQQAVFYPAFQRSAPYLHRTIPSFKASKRSPLAICSPRASSIQARASLAACGVYLPSRILRRSLSKEETEAISAMIGLEEGPFSSGMGGSREKLACQSHNSENCW